MINIPITSTFKKTGFKQAERSVSALEKSTKRLGAAFAATFGARQISRLTRQSIRAFITEDKAVQALSRNLQNLGIAYDVRPVEDYIRTLQYATGVADNELRPALQQLLTSTSNLAQSQELLNLALDISAGTGKSLSSVVQGLSRAYLGTNTSLTRLNIGLSKADLTSKSFNEITEELTKRFSGQAAKAAGTYAGQLAILGAAAGDAQEILGEKLVKSLTTLLDEDKGVPALAKSFEDVATYVGNVALGLATILSLYKELPFGTKTTGADFAKGFLTTLFPALRGIELLQEQGAKKTRKELQKQAMIARAIAKEQGVLRSRNLKIEEKITDEITKQEKLKKAGMMFEDEQISIAAALKNESLDRNEILRLELKKALINENASRAEKLAEQLGQSQRELSALANYRLANPFQAWEDSLERIRSGVSSLGVPVAPISPQGTITGQMPSVPSVVPPGQSGYIAPEISQGILDDVFGRGAVQAPTININVTGTGDLSDDTKKKIVDTIIDYSAIGYSTSGWYRTTGNVAI